MPEQAHAVQETAPAEILEIVQGLARELQPQRRGIQGTTLDSSLERDLGFDSLGRVELLTRLERSFGVRLPESVLATAETPRDLLRALAEARPGGPAALAEIGPESLEAGEAAPDRTQSLVEVLEWHARRHPGRRHVLFYGDGEPEELTYGELLRRARAAAQGIRAAGIERGQSVGLMLPSGLDYFVAFFGVLLAGGVPVPLYPPARRSQIEDHLRRQAGILATAQAGLLITFDEVLPLARLLRAQVPEVRRVTTVADLSSRDAPAALRPGEPEPPKPEDIAFLQFTSGSTGNPKGVVLTHANLLANLRAIGQGAELRPDDVVVSWLPLYHDMGLIGAWMGSLYFGIPLILLSPLSFLARPSRWLQAIHRHRGTLSAAPNFAYELCAAKIPDEELQGLDLSSWRSALNGAEPVSPEAIRRFTERFAPYGFRPGTMMPVYGLAENSLAVTFQVPGRPPRVDAVRREPFQRAGLAEPADPGNPGEPTLHFVSCGLPIPGVEVRIVDDTGTETGERRVGRLEFKSPSATSGYFRNPEATRRLFHGDWLDSGDLAYIAEGELYVTGRVKDMIIRAGRNLYPQEIEEAVGAIPGIRKGCVAVFGSPDPATGTERLVVLAETRERDEAALDRLRQAVQDAAVDLLGTPADDVVLAPPQTVPKTSSGKIRRQAGRELYESGRIGRRGTALWWQLVRLTASGLATRLSRRARVLADYLYATRVYLVVALVALPLWISMTLAPGTPRRRRLARRVARLLARAGGMLPEVRGLEHLADDGPRIVVSNHQSYLDGVLLTAALPPCFAYVVKNELERAPVAGGFLRRLGTVFVERFDRSQSAGESRKVLDALRAGDSVVIFVEGTFHRHPGLLPFRMGAFLVAAEAGVSVVPVTVRGTRSMLRGDDFFPRRGTAEVIVGPALPPEGTGWDAAVRLRDAARREILSYCGEPDLGAGS